MTTHPDLLQMAADDAVARSIPGQTFLAAAGDAWTDAFRRLFLAAHGQPGHVPPHAMSDDEGCEVKGGYGAMSIRKGQAADITTYKEAVAMFQRGATILDVVRRFGIPLNRARRWRREAGMGPSKGARRG